MKAIKEASSEVVRTNAASALEGMYRTCEKQLVDKLESEAAKPETLPEQQERLREAEKYIEERLVRLFRHGEIRCQGGFINPKSGRMSPLPINTPDKFRTPRSPKAWETSFARLGLTGVLEEVVAEAWMSDRRNPLGATCWN